MTIAARIRFALTAMILGIVYYYLLVYLVGWMSTHERPGWWIGMLAALPIAVAAVIIERTRAVLLALTAAVLATVAAVVPSLSSTIWPIIWSSNPILFVTDQAKLIVAVPLIAWVLRAASSNNRFERSRVASSVSQGGDR
jgi:hypothetical protein